MRTPRKLKKKKAKRGILIYDVHGLPESWTMRDLVKAFKYEGIVVWDSNIAYLRTGRQVNPPTVVNNLRGVRIVDLSENNSTLS